MLPSTHTASDSAKNEQFKNYERIFYIFSRFDFAFTYFRITWCSVATFNGTF